MGPVWEGHTGSTELGDAQEMLPSDANPHFPRLALILALQFSFLDFSSLFCNE